MNMLKETVNRLHEIKRYCKLLKKVGDFEQSMKLLTLLSYNVAILNEAALTAADML
jgi:hypothetical protein